MYDVHIRKLKFVNTLNKITLYFKNTSLAYSLASTRPDVQNDSWCHSSWEVSWLELMDWLKPAN